MSSLQTCDLRNLGIKELGEDVQAYSHAGREKAFDHVIPEAVEFTFNLAPESLRETGFPRSKELRPGMTRRFPTRVLFLCEAVMVDVSSVSF